MPNGYEIERGLEMTDGKHWEPARNPDDLARFLVQRANAGDVEGIVVLYEPDAVLAGTQGDLIVGTEAIRQFYTQVLADRPTFVLGEQRSALRQDDLALTSTLLTNGVVTAEVARRQSDGTWLWAIDQPAIAITDLR
jgi:ketosteroid isomerase-like protein